VLWHGQATPSGEQSRTSAHSLRIRERAACTGAFPYYLQFAKGDLRLHMIGKCACSSYIHSVADSGRSMPMAWRRGVSWIAANLLHFSFGSPSCTGDSPRFAPQMAARRRAADRIVAGPRLHLACKTAGMADITGHGGARLVMKVDVVHCFSCGFSLVREAIAGKWRTSP